MRDVPGSVKFERSVHRRSALLVAFLAVVATALAVPSSVDPAAAQSTEPEWIGTVSARQSITYGSENYQGNDLYTTLYEITPDAASVDETTWSAEYTGERRSIVNGLCDVDGPVLSQRQTLAGSGEGTGVPIRVFWNGTGYTVSIPHGVAPDGWFPVESTLWVNDCDGGSASTSTQQQPNLPVLLSVPSPSDDQWVLRGTFETGGINGCLGDTCFEETATIALRRADCIGAPDVDSDGLDICEEFDLGTDPNTPETDTDGDGVPDIIDECPTTPPGIPVDATGCSIDSDGDGVPDIIDACPASPPGVPVDATGCEDECLGIDIGLLSLRVQAQLLELRISGLQVARRGPGITPPQRRAILLDIQVLRFNLRFYQSLVRAEEAALRECRRSQQVPSGPGR